MTDPLSIAALTIAVLEQLWKIGERTGELISELRDVNWDNETRRIQNVIKDENNKTRALRLLLFESSRIYGGQTLFDQFDEEVQNQIQIFLEELVGVIDEAYQLLSRRLGIPLPSAPSSTFPVPGDLSKTSTLTSWKTGDFSLKTSKSIQRWRWSLLDKKRVATIIKNFSALNDRIHANIKLWCLSTSIGVDLQHLKRLEDDENSKRLGFDIDAKLQLASTDLQTEPESMELRDRTLQLFIQQAVNIENRFSMFDWDGTPSLVECRKYAPEASISVDLDERTRSRIEHLARLLHQPKGQVFRTLRCKGWIMDPLENQIAFVFSAPQATDTPYSLLRAVTTAVQKPSLGQKFVLAYELSRAISQFQLVKWVHESFRSENILLFRDANELLDKSTKSVVVLDYTQPWVLGFEFSRPEVDFSAGVADICPSRDVYRHPERQGKPTKPFNKLHDIYALGVVLLEIGLWQSAVSLDKDRFERVKDPLVVQRYLIRQAEKHLTSRMGDKYKAVVLKCRRSDFTVANDTKEDMKLQQMFRSQVVDVLGKVSECL